MKWLTIFFALLLVVIVIAADLGELPGFLKSIYDIPYGDKIGHFILVGLLSFFTNSSQISRCIALPPLPWLNRIFSFSMFFSYV